MSDWTRVSQMIDAAADLNTGRSFDTSLETDEYLRGQAELIADCGGMLNIDKYDIAALIMSVAQGKGNAS